MPFGDTRSHAIDLFIGSAHRCTAGERIGLTGVKHRRAGPRLEMRILFEELIPRLHALELTGEPKRSASTFVGGPKTLPVRFVLR